MVRAFLVVLALLGATSSAMAGATSPTSSGAGCRKANERPVIDKVDAGFCSGIVEGTMWSLQIAKLVCLPNGMTLGQGLKVLVKYMDDHPEELHEKTAELAARAFVKAWPCSHDSEKPADESFRKPQTHQQFTERQQKALRIKRRPLSPGWVGRPQVRGFEMPET